MSDGVVTVVAPHGDVLRVAPHRGGLVTGWLCHGPWGAREILYFDAERFTDPSKSVRGGIPVLFPICGGLQGSALPQHGFARDLPWRLEQLPHGSGVRLSLTDSVETRAVFPHHFGLAVEYRPEPQALAITVRVHNPASSGEPLPFSFGLHPYFTVPELDSVQFSGLPTGAVNQVTGAAGATVDLLTDLSRGVDVLTGPASAVRMTAGDIAVTLETQAPLDLTVVWTDPPRPMVCLEPWTAPRGALNSGERLLQVPAGGTSELHCRYRVEAAG